MRTRINWFAIIGMIFTLLCLNNWIEGKNTYHYYLLPAAFTLSTLYTNRTITFFGKAPGYTMFLSIAVLRYCLMPYYLSSTSLFFGFAANFKHLNDSIFLLIYEMMASFIFIRYRYKQVPLFYSNKKNDILIKSTLIYSITVLLFIGITAFNYSYYLRGISLLRQVNIENAKQYEMPVFINLIWGICLLWLYSYTIYSISRKILSTKAKVISSITLTLLLIFLTFVSQSSISRWYTIVCAFSGYFLLLKCYPKRKKIINLAVIVPLISLISVATLIKNFNDTKGKEDINITMGSFMNAYLAGPVSVNNGFGMNEQYEPGASAIIPDILNNMPVVNHYINRNNSTAYQYNKYIGRIFDEDGSQGDQIIPLISQGQTYFGYFLSPTLTLIFIWLFSMFDYRYMNGSGYKTFLFAFIACWCGLSPILNMTINISWWWIRIFPFMIFIYIVERQYNSRRIIHV